MTLHGRRCALPLALTLTLTLIPALAGAGAAQADALHVVAGGLANPRGLDVSPSGAIYVSEAGKGGKGPCFTGPDGDQACLGQTGAIVRIDPRSGRTRRVVQGLPSLAPPSGPMAGSNATGPQDVSLTPYGAYFTVGLGGPLSIRDGLGAAGKGLGRLYRVSPFGRVRGVADLAAFEAANDPDKGQPSAEVDSNPYSVDATNPFSILVTDAGGNDLLRVRPWGDVKVKAVFPFPETEAPPFLGLPPGAKIPYQPVPTGVVRIPGRGALVGQLTGFPFPVGAANVFAVGRHRSTPSVFAGGFTTVVDVARGPRGSVYVLQISGGGLLEDPPSPGRLWRIDRDGSRTELAAGKLQQPTGLAVSRRGDVYVANNGSSPTDGQIVRIRDHH